jgi:hypothetical protein
MIQENKDVSRILDPQQELAPLIGAAHGETRSLPLGGDQFHNFQTLLVVKVGFLDILVSFS